MALLSTLASAWTSVQSVLGIAPPAMPHGRPVAVLRRERAQPAATDNVGRAGSCSGGLRRWVFTDEESSQSASEDGLCPGAVQGGGGPQHSRQRGFRCALKSVFKVARKVPRLLKPKTPSFH